MKIQFNETVNISNELITYLKRSYKKEVPYTIEMIQNKFVSDYDNVIKYYQPIINYHELIEQYGIVRNQSFDLLFKPFPFNEDFCLVSFFEEKDNLEESEILFKLTEIVGTSITSKDNFIDELIKETTLDPETKYKIMLILFDYNSIRTIFQEYMAHYHELIIMLEKEISFDILEFKQFIDEKDVLRSVLKRIPKDHSFEEVIIEPIVLFENEMNVYLRDFGSDVLIVKISKGKLKIDQCLELSESLDERFLNSIKVLGEDTKFRILKSCSREAKYGAQLADELNIGTATISYHMQNLIASNYVETNVVKRRIYYKTNLEKIREDINLIDFIFV